MAEDGLLDDEITRTGWVTWKTEPGVLYDRNINLRGRVKMYKFFVRPAMMCGAETGPVMMYGAATGPAMM